MKNFIKRVENFTCAHCGYDVVGNGYTNHCPKCLWSRHVDNAPGDRAATCGGMMKPIAIETTKDSYTITHKCETCGKEIRQRAADNDDINTIITISCRNSFVFG